ncbi:hypothetical protein DIPPA_25345 [Diplonema papillatum]|nr:hypothetical protein DIPPA_25345 [Diplonema papillatum]
MKAKPTPQAAVLASVRAALDGGALGECRGAVIGRLVELSAKLDEAAPAVPRAGSVGRLQAAYGSAGRQPKPEPDKQAAKLKRDITARLSRVRDLDEALHDLTQLTREKEGETPEKQQPDPLKTAAEPLDAAKRLGHCVARCFHALHSAAGAEAKDAWRDFAKLAQDPRSYEFNLPPPEDLPGVSTPLRDLYVTHGVPLYYSPFELCDVPPLVAGGLWGGADEAAVDAAVFAVQSALFRRRVTGVPARLAALGARDAAKALRLLAAAEAAVVRTAPRPRGPRPPDFAACVRAAWDAARTVVLEATKQRVKVQYCGETRVTTVSSELAFRDLQEQLCLFLGVPPEEAALLGLRYQDEVGDEITVKTTEEWKECWMYRSDALHRRVDASVESLAPAEPSGGSANNRQTTLAPTLVLVVTLPSEEKRAPPTAAAAAGKRWHRAADGPSSSDHVAQERQRVPSRVKNAPRGSEAKSSAGPGLSVLPRDEEEHLSDGGEGNPMQDPTSDGVERRWDIDPSLSFRTVESEATVFALRNNHANLARRDSDPRFAVQRAPSFGPRRPNTSTNNVTNSNGGFSPAALRRGRVAGLRHPQKPAPGLAPSKAPEAKPLVMRGKGL